MQQVHAQQQQQVQPITVTVAIAKLAIVLVRKALNIKTFYKRCAL
jgi:hypothetical protein